MATPSPDSAAAMLQHLLSGGGVGDQGGNLVFFPMLVAVVAPPPADGEPPLPDRFLLVNPITNTAIELPDNVFELLMEGGGSPGVPPASKAAIQGLKTIAVGEIKTDEDCPVCMDEYGEKMVVKEMPCKHRFHEECIEKWLGMHGSCPICRFQMPGDDEEEKSSPSPSPTPTPTVTPAEEEAEEGEWGEGWSGFDHNRSISVEVPVEAGIVSRGWGQGWSRFDHGRAIGLQVALEESETRFDYHRAISVVDTMDLD